MSIRFLGLGDLLIASVGSSGAMMLKVLKALHPAIAAQVKAIAFASELDSTSLLRDGVLGREDIIEITGYGTAGDPERAEIEYLNKRGRLIQILSRKQPFSSVLISCFSGGGTGRCAYLFARDLLEEFSGPEGFPKIVVTVKLPVHNETQDMIRNTNDLLKKFNDLYEKYKNQLAVVIFSDGVSLEHLTPKAREKAMNLNYPDTTNVPIGDWFGTIIAAYSMAETNIADFFSMVTEEPHEGEYGVFGVPILCRAQIKPVPEESTEKAGEELLEKAREEAKAELLEKIGQIWAILDTSSLINIDYGIKERAGVYGCLWSPKVRDPMKQQEEINTFSDALKAQLRNKGAKEWPVHLKPLYYEGAETIDILGVLRGVKFKFCKYSGPYLVNSEEIEGKVQRGVA